eukprot:gene7525-17117_t
MNGRTILYLVLALSTVILVVFLFPKSQSRLIQNTSRTAAPTSTANVVDVTGHLAS